MNELVFEATGDDDPDFVRVVSLIVDGLVLQQGPDILAIVAVDNWFDHKWLDFSGKVMGTLGVWKHPLTIPPFHPNRVKTQTVYRLGPENQYEQIEAPPLHIEQLSGENLNRKLTHATDSGVFVWWSGNPSANAKASVMAYIQIGTDTTSCYISFDRRDQWEINKTKGISVESVRSLLRSAEPAMAANGRP